MNTRVIGRRTSWSLGLRSWSLVQNTDKDMATILVTGGGRGIGRAIALAFAEPGSTVAIASRTRSELEETGRAITKRGAEAVLLTADVTDEASVASAFKTLRNSCG